MRNLQSTDQNIDIKHFYEDVYITDLKQELSENKITLRQQRQTTNKLNSELGQLRRNLQQNQTTLKLYRQRAITTTQKDKPEMSCTSLKRKDSSVSLKSGLNKSFRTMISQGYEVGRF
jgi:hypothetical protein